ncbi:helix-turn-helix transcriptional regulator [Streptomyces sodiiphilus]|uniref:Helix-turn-helix transcriptional regulator n=1 Tax=Streptomyces sodiiphilus TaxID=226217 RepID=A0ABP5AA73_9ACTN
MTVEQEIEETQDPAVSTLAHFGREVRLEREQHGMSKADLGREVHCHPTLVGKIETAQRVPTLDFAEACDRVFNTGGRLARLWPLVIRHAYPKWFRAYVELEAVAKAIGFFQIQVVPGLLQTEDYARAVLASGRLDNPEDVLTARMERQRILTRDDPPQVWAILEESVLHRTVGGRKVMGGQLQHLLTACEHPRTVIQIIPASITTHAAMGGSFAALAFDEGSDIVYIDGFPEGHVTAEPRHVETVARAYDLLRATALSPEASVDLMTAIAKGVYS